VCLTFPSKLGGNALPLPIGRPTLTGSDRSLPRRRTQHKRRSAAAHHHQHLTGESARLISQTFGTASNNALAASVAAVVGFLTWGIGVGQIYQDVYARAWRIQVRALSDQARFTIWFFVLSGLLGVWVDEGGPPAARRIVVVGGG
jgi:hypothetical protein